MRAGTRDRVREYMVSFADRILRDRRRKVADFVQKALAKYPFHMIFFSVRSVVVSQVERSITAAVGMAFYTTIAKIIAEERFSIVKTNHTLDGRLDEGQVAAVNRVLEELDRGRARPDADRELDVILGARAGEARRVEITADFYIGDYPLQGRRIPVFIEFKTPWPKKEDCIRSKRRLLLFRAMHGGRALAYVGIPYDPFGGDKGAWWTIKRVFDPREVLLGGELWDFVGGDGTFEELCGVAREVSGEVRPRVEGLTDEIDRQLRSHGEGW